MEFVNFELAKKLKEKGFREKVNAYYGRRENIFDVHPALDMNDADYRCSAPTIPQVLKWLREEKVIYISIFVDDDSDCPVTYEIWKDKECVCSHQGEYFTMKEWNKCELRAIEYVIDNLI